MKRAPIIILVISMTLVLIFFNGAESPKDIIKKKEQSLLEHIGKSIVIDDKEIILSKIKKPIVLHFCVSWSYHCQKNYKTANLIRTSIAYDFYYIDLSEKKDMKEKGYLKLLDIYKGNIFTDKDNDLSSKFLLREVPSTYKISKDSEGKLILKKMESLKELL